MQCYCALAGHLGACSKDEEKQAPSRDSTERVAQAAMAESPAARPNGAFSGPVMANGKGLVIAIGGNTSCYKTFFDAAFRPDKKATRNVRFLNEMEHVLADLQTSTAVDGMPRQLCFEDVFAR